MAKENFHRARNCRYLSSKERESARIARCVVFLPDALLETVSKVVTPSVVLPATESTSIQKETQEMTTIRIVGRYDWTMWKPRERLRWSLA